MQERGLHVDAQHHAEQISAASGRPGASTFWVIGAIIGRMMNAISKKSRKNARKMKMLMNQGSPRRRRAASQMVPSQVPPDAEEHPRSRSSRSG